MHPASPAGSSRAATAILVALSRSSSGYFFGVGMVLILPWDHSLHQTRGDSPVGPVLYDRGFSWEDSNGIQHGWGGRSRP